MTLMSSKNITRNIYGTTQTSKIRFEKYYYCSRFLLHFIRSALHGMRSFIIYLLVFFLFMYEQ